MKQPIHFSGLNGLRAIAALSVLFCHTTASLGEFGLDPFVFGEHPKGTSKIAPIADFGVTIFFVLSGFLITYLLLEEKKTGEINIKNFYMRRILRIWPLYYLYFFLAVITLYFSGQTINPNSTLFYVFFAANIPFISGSAVMFIAHFWSIGVEEQFYSLWPLIVKKINSLLKITIIACVCLLVLKCSLRFYDIYSNAGKESWAYLALHISRFHCMLFGAIGAILFFQKNTTFIKLATNIYVQGIAWISIFLVAVNKFHIASFIDNEIIAVLTVFIIISQIEKKNRIINLEVSVLNFLGKISFGIYVIHPLVTYYLSKLFSNSHREGVLNYLFVYAVVFSASIIAAVLSYEFYEKRFLKMKDKYSSVRSSATMEIKMQN